MTPIDKKQPLTRDETEIYALIERWAIAIRDCDKPNIRADHHDNMLTFNVSPPMSARGIESYTATWDAFLPGSTSHCRSIFMTWTWWRAPMSPMRRRWATGLAWTQRENARVTPSG